MIKILLAALLFGGLAYLAILTKRRMTPQNTSAKVKLAKHHMTLVKTDHDPGNAVPVKTVQPFKKISAYLFSPWNPLENTDRVNFYDADNMPVSHIVMPGGNRLVVHGLKNHGNSHSQSPFPVHGATPGRGMKTQTPIKVQKMDKNLNHHSTLFHSRLNR